MENLTSYFDDSDEAAFIAVVSSLIERIAHEERGLSVAAYVDKARAIWSSCQTDEVYAVKLLFDPVLDPIDGEDDIFCVLVARLAPDGSLLDAPAGYQRPDYPGVRFEHIVAGSPITVPDSTQSSTYILAFLDVLGFEARLTQMGLAAMHELYKQLLDRALKPQSEDRPVSKVTSVVRGGLVPALMWSPIQASYFSDSLLLWIPYSDSVRGNALVEDFFRRCARVFCQALEIGLPVRGSISVGEAVLDKESGIYLGSPLVEAARLESKQNWIGVSLGSSFKRNGMHIPVSSVIRYAPPLKEDGERFFSGLVLDWPRVWRETKDESAVDALRAFCVSGLPENLKQRYISSMQFYEFSERNSDWDVPEGYLRLRV